MITKCALAVITQHGNSVVPPSISELAADEQKFLAGHVDKLRRTKGDKDTRGRFRDGSSLQSDFSEAITADDAQFLAIAGRLVDQLATAMKGSNSANCVFAFVIDSEVDGQSTANILKLTRTLKQLSCGALATPSGCVCSSIFCRSPEICRRGSPGPTSGSNPK